MLCWAGLGWLAGCCWLATHCVCGAASFNSVTSTCPPHNRLSRTQPPTAHRLPPPPPPPPLLCAGWRAERQELQRGGGGGGHALHPAGGRGAGGLHHWWVLRAARCAGSLHWSAELLSCGFRRVLGAGAVCGSSSRSVSATCGLVRCSAPGVGMACLYAHPSGAHDLSAELSLHLPVRLLLPPLQP